MEGFEPSYLVLETRVLAIERHPYIQGIFLNVNGNRTRYSVFQEQRPTNRLLHFQSELLYVPLHYINIIS